LYYQSTSSTIYAVKYPSSVVEYTTGLVVSFTNNLSGYYLWSITASGNTFYIGTQNGLVLVMTNRVVTGFYDACNSKVYQINSMVIQGTTMMTNCYRDLSFYTGNGSSFSFLSAMTDIGYPNGVWVDLNNQLVFGDGDTWVKIYYDNTISTTTATTTTTRTVISLDSVRSYNSTRFYSSAGEFHCQVCMVMQMMGSTIIFLIILA
jgi:hypothetical protein